MLILKFLKEGKKAMRKLKRILLNLGAVLVLV